MTEQFLLFEPNRSSLEQRIALGDERWWREVKQPIRESHLESWMIVEDGTLPVPDRYATLPRYELQRSAEGYW
jgi:hypothetical protein